MLSLGASGAFSVIGTMGLKALVFRPPKSNVYSSRHHERARLSCLTAPWMRSQEGPWTLHLTSRSSMRAVLAPKIRLKDFPVKSAGRGGYLPGYAILKQFNRP